MKYSGKWLVRHLAAGAVVLAGMAAFVSPAMAQQSARQFLPTITTVTATPSTVAVGGTSTLTATVDCFGAPPGRPSGTVFFFDSTASTFLGSAPLVTFTPTGTATLTATFGAPAGSHTVVAQYSGDGVCNSSTGTTTVTVSSATGSTTTLTASTTNPRPFRQVVFTATVTCTTGSPVGGRVLFTDNGTPFAILPVIGAPGSPIGSVSTSTLFVSGTHLILARFRGTPGCAASTSNPVTIHVRSFPFAGSGAGVPATDEDLSEDASSGTAVQ